jgi:hypothetical protein
VAAGPALAGGPSAARQPARVSNAPARIDTICGILGEDLRPGRAVMTGVVVPAAEKPRFRDVSELSRRVIDAKLRAG